MNDMKRFLHVFLFVAIAGALSAQDLHYSQFYNSPLNINPGKTGIFNGDKRFMLSYRNQWTNVVPWRTFSGSYDKKFYPKRGDSDNFFSGGILINYDKQENQSDLTLFNLNLTGSYTWVFNESNIFTGGLLLGYAQRAIDPTSRTWDKQWNGSQFDPDGPKELTEVQDVSFMETGLGFNYRWQRNRRTKLDLGLGIFHLFEPNIAFLDGDDITLPRRFSLTGQGSIELAEKFDLQLNAMGQFQGKYREFQFSGLGKIYVNQQRGNELEVHLGLGYRAADYPSLFPIFAIQYKNRFYGSINYDLDLSGFADDHPLKRPSTIELHFNYIITDVKPFKKMKVCPIF